MKNKYNKQLLPGLSICLFASFLTGCNRTQGSSTPSNIATQRANVPSNENNEGNAKKQENNEEGTDTKTDIKSTPVPSQNTKKPEKLAADIEKNHKMIKQALDISKLTWFYMTERLKDIPHIPLILAKAIKITLRFCGI